MTFLATITETLVRCRGVLALPDRIVGLRDRIDHLHTAISNTADAVRILSKRPDAPTFVYVLPADGEPMMAQCIRLEERDGVGHLSWPLHTLLAPKSWIVAVGPSVIRGVRLGNVSQESFSGDYTGHVCQTKDPGEIGVYLTVQLKRP